MIYEIQTERFEGPLDLLLALISKHKIDIFDIPIAEICEQYTGYINAMRELDMEVTSEFIVMASELMLIKSRMLLPKEENAPDPRKELVDALLEYSRAKQAAEFLKKQSEMYYDRFTKAPDEADNTYFSLHDSQLLVIAFERIQLRRASEQKEEKPIELFERFEKERYYTVEEKTDKLLRQLSRDRKTPFEELFDDCETANEAVAVFLALLELIRLGVAEVAFPSLEITLSDMEDGDASRSEANEAVATRP